LPSLASQVLNRMKERWGRLNPSSRWLVAGIGVALVVAVAAVGWLYRPEWVVLVSDVTPKDAAAIVARLNELKVPYQPSGESSITIMVPKKEQYTAKLALAQADLPKGTSVGMELFDAPKFGATEFDRKVNYLRAQQGELERALMRIAEVEYANVKLAIPERSVFTRDQQPVTAAVLIQPRPGKKLTPEQIVGIVNFIAGSVEGLSPENVKVVDQNGRLLSNGITATGELGLSSLDNDQLQRQLSLQRDLENRVQTLLEPIFGVGNVVARVNLELNTEASRIENTTVGGSTPRSTETSRESVAGTAGAPAQQGTTNPNTPPVYQGQNPNNGGANDVWRTHTKTDYAVSERKEITLVSPGSVKRISVGIAINRTDLTPDQIKMIQDTVAGATGADPSSISVAALPFKTDLPAELAAPKPGFTLKPEYLAAILGSAAVLLLLAMIISFIRNRRSKAEEPLPFELDLEPQLAGIPLAPAAMPGTAEPAPAGAPATGSVLDTALGLDTAGQPGPAPGAQAAPDVHEEEEPVAEAESGTEIIQSPQQRFEIVMKRKPKRRIVLDGQPPDEQLMEHVDELIDTSPEACAEILRQWLKS
jgi:flagellar M-ring protein FliF